MTVYVTALIICITAVELFTRAPLKETIADLLQYAKNSRRVISSNYISDHWKEKVLPAYSKKLAQSSFKIFFIFGIVLAVLLVLSKVLDYLFLSGESTIEYLSTMSGILFATIVSIGYYYVRTTLLKK